MPTMHVYSERYGLEIFTVYWRPLDYPEHCVVRRSWIRPGETDRVNDPVLWAQAATIEEAREAIPEGLFCIPRQEDDDPVIVECWI